jgi:hypothetical protein
MTVTADDLDSVISCVMSGLLPITDRDWSVRAGTLEWDQLASARELPPAPARAACCVRGTCRQDSQP